MEESCRTVRAYSEDTERPYYQIRYKLSLTGRELLVDALAEDFPNNCRANRTDSVCTTILEGSNDPTLNDAMDIGEKGQFGRICRSRSLETPSDNVHMADLASVSSNLPSTPKSSHRKSAQRQNQIYQPPPSVEEPMEIRRTMSAGTAAEMHMNRGAPAVPIDTLQFSNDQFPKHMSEDQGLVTCLNSKNVSKYRIGQNYRKGLIIGIDENQGKIVVLQKSMPKGSLVAMRSENPERYEKGYLVQDVHGRSLGTVHALDISQHLLIVNTSIQC